jgi:hypothetical protein
VAAWGVVAVGTTGLVAIPAILATVHAADVHFLWWWPTNWMAIPLAVFVTGIMLAVVPIMRAREPATSAAEGTNGKVAAARDASTYGERSIVAGGNISGIASTGDNSTNIQQQ